MDGKLYKTLKEAQPVILHRGDRCVLLPYFNIEGDTRASKNGYVDSKVTFSDWLKEQDEKTQLDVLGRARFEMYKNGTPITQFVDNGKVLTLKELNEKLGIKSKTSLVDNPKSAARETLEKLNVPAREVVAFEKPMSEKEIIDRVGGADKTKGGSCSSVAFAYTANKAGFDVLDFRDGKSKEIFSRRSTIEEIAKLNGVKSKIIEKINDYSAAHELYKEMAEEKQYYLAVGRHAAIVQRKEGSLQWLEMQSAKAERRTWHTLDDDVLNWRFSCKKSHSSHGQKYAISSILIDIESLGKNKEFIELMKYINTSENAQVKGAGGYAK